MLTRIVTADAPRPNGHYEQGVVSGGFLFVSTQLPIQPETGALNDGSIEDQALQVLQNILAIVTAGGSSLNGIVRVTLYVSDVSLWPRVNAVYERFFGDARPARGVIPTGPLHLGAAVAADCIAVVPQDQQS